jgi:hypothetical protein
MRAFIGGDNDTIRNQEIRNLWARGDIVSWRGELRKIKVEVETVTKDTNGADSGGQPGWES